jgi:hypothetical protein
MPTPPPFPTRSLYGPFPAFPTYTYRVGWNIMGTYYEFQVQLPNLAGIPYWGYSIVIWLLGWIGATFEWVFIWSSDQLINIFEWGIQTGNTEFQNLVNTSQAISSQTGIFQPLILTVFLILITGAAILIIMAAANLIRRIT